MKAQTWCFFLGRPRRTRYLSINDGTPFYVVVIKPNSWNGPRRKILWWMFMHCMKTPPDPPEDSMDSKAWNMHEGTYVFWGMLDVYGHLHLTHSVLWFLRIPMDSIPGKQLESFGTVTASSWRSPLSFVFVFSLCASFALPLYRARWLSPAPFYQWN